MLSPRKKAITETPIPPAPPTTAQIPGPGPIFSAEFVLSIPPSSRIRAATQPEKS